jgi:hypothetical protein
MVPDVLVGPVAVPVGPVAVPLGPDAVPVEVPLDEGGVVVAALTTV